MFFPWVAITPLHASRYAPPVASTTASISACYCAHRLQTNTTAAAALPTHHRRHNSLSTNHPHHNTQAIACSRPFALRPIVQLTNRINCSTRLNFPTFRSDIAHPRTSVRAFLAVVPTTSPTSTNHTNTHYPASVAAEVNTAYSQMPSRNVRRSRGSGTSVSPVPLDEAAALDTIHRHAITARSQQQLNRNVVHAIPASTRIVMIGEASHGTKEFYNMVRQCTIIDLPPPHLPFPRAMTPRPPFPRPSIPRIQTTSVHIVSPKLSSPFRRPRSTPGDGDTCPLRWSAGSPYFSLSPLRQQLLLALARWTSMSTTGDCPFGIST